MEKQQNRELLLAGWLLSGCLLAVGSSQTESFFSFGTTRLRGPLPSERIIIIIIDIIDGARNHRILQKQRASYYLTD
jgi:hypothetical protein